jgi:hypothetical protein
MAIVIGRKIDSMKRGANNIDGFGETMLGGGWESW